MPEGNETFREGGQGRLNDDSDVRIDIGWFDQNDPPSKMDVIGFSIVDGVRLQAVARPTGSGGLTNSSNVDLPDGQYDFTISYDGLGQLQVTFADPKT